MNKKITYFMKSAFILAVLLSGVCACQESFEAKAERDAKDYTRKYCPTPVVNYMRTDSVTFNASKSLYTYFCTFVDVADNQEVINDNKHNISDAFRNSIKESVTMKKYLDKGIHFRMVGRSGKDNKQVLITVNL